MNNFRWCLFYNYCN